MRLFWLLLIGLFMTQTTAQDAQYTNPIVTPVAADPSIIRAPDGTFYLYATQDDWGEGNHYIPIFRSDDLINWTFVKDAFTWPPEWKAGGGFLWAPDVSKRGDTYYLYYAASLWGDPNPCIGLATASQPEGPWEDLGRAVFCSEEIGVDNSIDPFVFYEDETGWLIWGSFGGIYAVELNGDGTEAVGDPVPLADTRFEAPYVIQREGFYYLFLSAGSCCEGAESTYQTLVGRSENLLGPYLDAEGQDLNAGGGTLLLERNDTWVGPGHNAVIQDDAGTDWVVYHAIPAADPKLANGVNRRPVLLESITWTDGWPVVNNGEGPSSAPQSAPVVGSP